MDIEEESVWPEDISYSNVYEFKEEILKLKTLIAELKAEKDQADTSLNVIGNPESDYVLHPDADSVWITVGLMSVHVRRQHRDVAVDIYPLGDECSDAVGSTYVSYSDIQLKGTYYG